jgi:hypothetical protein
VYDVSGFTKSRVTVSRLRILRNVRKHKTSKSRVVPNPLSSPSPLNGPRANASVKDLSIWAGVRGAIADCASRVHKPSKNVSQSKIVPALLQWFRQNARDLPWRRTTAPYAIWISEVMISETYTQ